MTVDVRAVLTEALAAHDFIPFAMRCRCGWRYGDGTFAAHQADVLLALSGVAVTQLPDEAGISAQHIRFGTGADCECCPPWITDDDAGIDYSTTEARELAAALLAAAVLAEGETR